jgi:tetratricopeptide (TPR) repeat protein
MATALELGVEALRRGAPAEAITCLAPLARAGDNPPAMYLLGVAHLAAGAAAEAEHWLLTGWRAGLRNAGCALALAAAREQRGDVAGAEAALRAIPGEPKLAAAYAQFLERNGRAGDALAQWANLVAANPRDEEARIRYALALVNHRRYHEAVGQLEAIPPERRAAINGWTHLSCALAWSGRFQQAEAAASAALAHNPRDAAAWRNLALAQEGLRRLDEALESFENALAVAPDDAQLHWAYALALLKAGRWHDAAAHLSYRVPAGITWPLSTRWPVWQGEPIAGKTIYVRAEQGLGDTLQLARFTRLLAQTGARVQLAVQAPLIELLRAQPWLDAVYGFDEIPAGIDCQVLLMDVPGLLDRTPPPVPPCPPLLVPETTRQEWAAKLAHYRQPRIAINWRGNPHYAWDHLRSASREIMAPLLAESGITWFHLDPAGGETPGCVNPLPPGATVADTAAVLLEMDLVITTDTMLCHLAGSLGVPVWTLLSRYTDWRWPTSDETETPWYPTMRLFYQQTLGDWPPVVAAVANELQRWRAEKWGHNPVK